MAAAPKSHQDRRALVEYIASRGMDGSTDEETMAACPQIHTNGCRARRGEAWGFGLITDSLGLQRPTSTGSMAKCWHVTEAGLRALDLDPETNWHSAKRAAV